MDSSLKTLLQVKIYAQRITINNKTTTLESLQHISLLFLHLHNEADSFDELSVTQLRGWFAA